MSGPEDGHTFEITVRIRGSHRVVGEPHRDDDEFSDLPMKQTVRAWNLRDALMKVQDVPFHEWFEQEDDE